MRVPVKTVQLGATALDESGQLYDASLSVSWPLNAGVTPQQVDTVIRGAIAEAQKMHTGLKIRTQSERTGYTNVESNVGQNIDEEV